MTQRDYLAETYHGSVINMNEHAAYYCYTIHDEWTDQFYSGSRGVEGTDEHDLLTGYFTSSTVVDFVERMRRNPDKFKFHIEYFGTREAAFEAEKRFHWTHDVGKNTRFLNVIKSGGTHCGAGTVRCRRDDGSLYRVSCKEYASGDHVSACANKMNVRVADGTLEKIHRDDFDPTLHTTQFKDHIMSINVVTGTTCRVHRDIYEADENLAGITSGLVMAINRITNERVQVTQSEFDASDDYVGQTFGTFPVIDLTTGKTIIISRDDYDRTKYKHANSKRIVAYSLEERKNVTVSQDVYYANEDKYANQATKVFFVIDGLFFKSKKLASDYYKSTRGKGFLHKKQTEISKEFLDIKSITRKEHENAKN